MPVTTASDLKSTVGNGIRLAFGIGGVLALVVGLLILLLPAKTAMVVTAIIAVYAVIAGIVYAGIGIFTKGKGGWARVGYILLGIVFIIAGIVAFSNLGQTAVVLAVFIGILVGIVWIAEGIVALSTLGDASSKVWSILFAILSIIAGIVLLFSPLWGAVVLWWLLGISLAVLGIVNIIRAFTYGKKKA